MKYYKAAEIVEILSESYLFSGILTYAGFDEDDYDEQIMEMFKHITGVGMYDTGGENYVLNIYHITELQHKEIIAEHFNIGEKEIVFFPCDPFVFLTKERPLLIGCSISHIDSINFGTLGCFVESAEKHKYLLSNLHVLYNANADYKDDFIIQPGKSHGGTETDSVALFADRLPFDTKDINEYDAALAGPISIDIDIVIPHMAHGKAINGTTEGVTGQKVFKCGAATALSFGIIGAVRASFKIELDGQVVAFKNQLVINGMNAAYENPGAFCQPGDSGSVVIEEGSASAVGLLFAGSKNGAYALCNPIDAVLRKLGVAILNF